MKIYSCDAFSFYKNQRNGVYSPRFIYLNEKSGTDETEASWLNVLT